MALSDDLGRIGAIAARYAQPAESIAAVLAVEPTSGERLYLCAFQERDGAQSWLVLDDSGAAVTTRERVRDAASIAALCEVAEDGAGMNGDEPRVASLERLDSIGPAAGAAIQSALPAVDELAKDIETNYRVELS